MSTQPPQDPQRPSDVAPPGYREPADYQQTAYQAAPPERQGHAGPWILGAAIVLVIGALLAVVIHDSTSTDTQTVINRTQSVNTTSVQRSAPTVTQSTTTVTQPAKTVTQNTTTVTQPAKTVTASPTTTAPATTTAP